MLQGSIVALVTPFNEDGSVNYDTQFSYQFVKDAFYGGMDCLKKECEQLKEQVEDLKSDHEYNLKLMKGLNNKISKLEKQNKIYYECMDCPYNAIKQNGFCKKCYKGKL